MTEQIQRPTYKRETHIHPQKVFKQLLVQNKFAQSLEEIRTCDAQISLRGKQHRPVLVGWFQLIVSTQRFWIQFVYTTQPTEGWVFYDTDH